MFLTDIAIHSARPADKLQHLFDGNGLYLEVSPAGGKWWRLKYRIDGKEKRLSIGVYPEVSLGSQNSTSTRPMSINSLTGALRRLGYDGAGSRSRATNVVPARRRGGAVPGRQLQSQLYRLQLHCSLTMQRPRCARPASIKL